MKHQTQRSSAIVLGLALAFSISVVNTPSQKTRNVSKKRSDEATKESNDAAKVFTEIMDVPEKGIPQELFDKAEAIAVFPNVIKAAFIIGGRGGDGVISRRTSTGWSAPAFFNIGGGSFGAQIGAESTDYVLLFMNEGALKGLLEDKFEFGGEASVAAGPVGRTASAGTNLTLDAGILSYSRSKGAFIGASIQGAVVSPDNDLNEAIYGMKANGILAGRRLAANESPDYVRIFPQTIARYSMRK